jgi:hypothetical protein
MKGGHAAVWADQVIRYESLRGFPKFLTWSEFKTAFEEAFFPENEAAEARMKLESTSYFQSKWSVDVYVDEFEDLVQLSGYTDRLTIVVKFRRGLHSNIQDRIAEMGIDRPEDNDPDGWYRTARLFDQNQCANEAFNSSAAHKPFTATSVPTSGGGQICLPPLAFTSWPHTHTSCGTAAN